MTKDIIRMAREAGVVIDGAMHDLARLGQEIEQGKRGSIALARSLCYEIAGATSEDDMDGGEYGSVDIAEILSAEVLRLQAALAQPEQQAETPKRPWVGLTDEDWGWVADRKGTSLDSFDQGAAWAQARLQERNK